MAHDGMKPLMELTAEQMAAVEPARNVWLSASAGSGKTQVLSARVIRLLLEDRVEPENILCLTFTKAAAAEMAERINQRLATWVQLKGPQLASELRAIGAEEGPVAQKRARGLFAKVLDAPGGLQIMTIHSFCQSLLASFPEEAGLLPGFEAIEGRALDDLLADSLHELLSDADGRGLGWIVENLRQLSIELGEAGAISFLNKCAQQAATLLDIPSDTGAMVVARRLVGVDFDGPVLDELARQCADDFIDTATLDLLSDMNREWGTARGIARAGQIDHWRSLSAEDRANELDEIHYCFTKKDGDPLIASKGFTPTQESYPDLALEMHRWTNRLVQLRALAEYAERFGRALQAGSAFAEAYAAAKHQRAVVDFNDMIRSAAALLSKPGISEWVRYKLDRRIDHILIDESQDTNQAQWTIIKSLSDDFFSGSGAKAESRARTLFTVGDYKQAIYGFQGTDPEKYAAAHVEFREAIEDADTHLHDLTLTRSFRSTGPILEFVNRVIETAGHEKFGLDGPVPDHRSELSNSGSIELLRCVSVLSGSDSAEDAEDAEEDWITTEKLRLASLIAQRVKRLIDDAPWLASKQRRLLPGDIMILLRKRTDLAELLVARLHEAQVPVAGIDRLKLSASLAVQDLIACINFALQPDDDLSLACILVSPLVGWSQEQLLEHGHREAGTMLWEHLRAAPHLAETIAPLRNLLNAADNVTPFEFVENLLSGPMAGRRKLSARLGKECLVPIEELLNLVLTFQQQGGHSLQGFVDWYARGEGDIKREGLAQSADVRILTVHGAKGLEAPVIILADIAGDPLKKGGNRGGPDLLLDGDGRLPMLNIRKEERYGQLDEAVELEKARELREHHRLLYVALTRAEEHLILAGSLSLQRKGEVPEHSWFNVLEPAMGALGAAWQDEPDWGAHMLYKAEAAATDNPAAAAEAIERTAEPDWLRQPAPPESRPPRPLAPSDLGDDDYGDGPASEAMQQAAERGRLIHGLFEHYDGSDPDAFAQIARNWVQREMRGGGIDAATLVETVLSVLRNPEWKPLFSSAARPEVPLAALVGEVVITGRIDRLLVEVDRVVLIDFKTGRSVPSSPDAVPIAHIRQMAAYVAALETIFPGRTIQAALLFTHGPAMIALPDELIARHKPAMAA
jgi:ATP-dependent helicase/nuclease subunit A